MVLFCVRPFYFFVCLVPLSDSAKLQEWMRKSIVALNAGEPLRRVINLLVDSLSHTECFLLLSSYIASHKPQKYDLRVFGTIKRRRGPRRTLRSGKISKAVARDHRSPPKAFTFERLLAIFYFITPSPVPPITDVYQCTIILERRGLLARASAEGVLDCPKFRCTLPIDTMALIATKVDFDLVKYLSISFN